MAITMRFADLHAEQIAFGYSPAQETLASLHILTDYRHHPLHIPWAVKTRKEMRPALRAEADAFAALFARPIAAFWHPQPEQPFRTFEEEIALLQHAPAAEYLTVIIEALSPAKGSTAPSAEEETWRMVSDRVARTAPQSLTVVEEARDMPERSRNRFVAFLTTYWETCLAADWARIEGLFLQDIAERGRNLYRAGPMGLLSNLTPALWLDGDAGIAIARHQLETTVTVTDTDVLFLVPSYFAWPHLRVTIGPPLSIVYPVVAIEEIGGVTMPRDRLLQLLRALGDDTRLEILQLLAHRPRSTQELAGLVGRTEAATSKHLKQLQAAGLLSAERRGYYVLYRLVAAPLQELMQGLAQFTHQGHGSGDEG